MGRWPLDKSPLWYSSQGDKVADMIQMLLRIRGVPPKTYRRVGDGIVATDGEGVAREFFEKLNLSCEFLLFFFHWLFLLLVTSQISKRFVLVLIGINANVCDKQTLTSSTSKQTPNSTRRIRGVSS